MCLVPDDDSFTWPFIQHEAHAQVEGLPPHEAAHEPIPGGVHPGRPLHRWRRNVLQPVEPLQPRQGGNTCVHILIRQVSFT